LRGARESWISHHAGLRHEKRAEFGLIETGDFHTPVIHQLPAATRTAKSENGNACGTQCFHVTVKRAFGDFETFGEFAAREASVALKQEHNRKETICSHSWPIATNTDCDKYRLRQIPIATNTDCDKY
jgi:hypothetical protein